MKDTDLRIGHSIRIIGETAACSVTKGRAYAVQTDTDRCGATIINDHGNPQYIGNNGWELVEKDEATHLVVGDVIRIGGFFTHAWFTPGRLYSVVVSTRLGRQSRAPQMYNDKGELVDVPLGGWTYVSYPKKKPLVVGDVVRITGQTNAHAVTIGELYIVVEEGDNLSSGKIRNDEGYTQHLGTYGWELAQDIPLEEPPVAPAPHQEVAPTSLDSLVVSGRFLKCRVAQLKKELTANEELLAVNTAEINQHVASAT
jgi:hypothetical protein